MTDDNTALVTVNNLKKHFPIHRGIIVQRAAGAVKAVDGISFNIARDIGVGRRKWLRQKYGWPDDVGTVSGDRRPNYD